MPSMGNLLVLPFERALYLYLEILAEFYFGGVLNKLYDF